MNRISTKPYYHTNDDNPLILSWVAITCFCLWSSIMYISLSVSYIKYENLEKYASDSETVREIFVQNGLEFLLIFISIFIIVFLYLIAFHIMNFGNYYLALFQFYYFLIGFLTICYIQRDIIFYPLVSEFMLLPIQQGLVMTVLLAFSGRAIDPSSNSDSSSSDLINFNSFESTQFHFENWWRLARLGMTGILSISIGAAITITISDSSTLSVPILLANIFLSAIPGTLFVVIMVKKVYWFNRNVRNNFNN